MHIRDIHNPWRDALLPASFKNVEFHVESASEDNGRRIVVHEFPKKESPYAEDMGRRAFGYMVRGYCISYMVDTDIPLYQRDYRVPRDLRGRVIRRAVKHPISRSFERATKQNCAA